MKGMDRLYEVVKVRKKRIPGSGILKHFFRGINKLIQLCLKGIISFTRIVITLSIIGTVILGVGTGLVVLGASLFFIPSSPSILIVLGILISITIISGSLLGGAIILQIYRFLTGKTGKQEIKNMPEQEQPTKDLENDDTYKEQEEVIKERIPDELVEIIDVKGVQE